jgi:hypothetical protein
MRKKTKWHRNSQSKLISLLRSCFDRWVMGRPSLQFVDCNTIVQGWLYGSCKNLQGPLRQECFSRSGRRRILRASFGAGYSHHHSSLSVNFFFAAVPQFVPPLQSHVPCFSSSDPMLSKRNQVWLLLQGALLANKEVCIFRLLPFLRSSSEHCKSKISGRISLIS